MSLDIFRVFLETKQIAIVDSRLRLQCATHNECFLVIFIEQKLIEILAFRVSLPLRNILDAPYGHHVKT